MTDLERKNDPHCAIGGEVLAQECVEHIFAAEPALSAAAIPIVDARTSYFWKKKRAWVAQCCRCLVNKSVCSGLEHSHSGSPMSHV